MKTLLVCLLALRPAGVSGEPVPIPSTGGFLYQTAESAHKPLPASAGAPISPRNTVLFLAAIGATLAVRGLWRRRDGEDA